MRGFLVGGGRVEPCRLPLCLALDQQPDEAGQAVNFPALRGHDV